jgi:hypothetical protein
MKLEWYNRLQRQIRGRSSLTNFGDDNYVFRTMITVCNTKAEGPLHYMEKGQLYSLEEVPFNSKEEVPKKADRPLSKNEASHVVTNNLHWRTADALAVASPKHRFSAHVFVPLSPLHIFPLKIISYKKYDTQQTEDEDSLTVVQGWNYILVGLPLVPRYYSYYKRRKQLYEGGGGGAGG